MTTPCEKYPHDGCGCPLDDGTPLRTAGREPSRSCGALCDERKCAGSCAQHEGHGGDHACAPPGYDPAGRKWSVTIEFDDRRDYEEFLREHGDRRCSDLGDWNQYRVVEPSPPARETT